MDQQMLGPDHLLDKIAAFPQGDPGEIQDRQIDGNVCEPLCQNGTCQLAVPGDQDLKPAVG